MRDTLTQLKKKYIVGFVGGSDLKKISEQLAPETKNGEHFVSNIQCPELRSPNPAVELFDFGFAENGLTAYRLGKELPAQSFIKHVGEEDYKKIVNFCLHYVADLDIPIKR